MRITLIRHGKTRSNTERRYTGVTDVPLSMEGRAETERARHDETVLTVIVSPLLRARETAAILFPNAKQIVADGLKEMDLGAFEGRTAEEMQNDPVYRAWVEGGGRGMYPGGESIDTFRTRVCASFLKTLETAEDGAIYVVHGGVIMAILSAFAVPNRDFYEWDADNLGGYVCEVETAPGGIVLRNPQTIHY